LRSPLSSASTSRPLVPILDRLEKAGLLTRTASQRDRRVRIPRPTPAGQQVVGTVAIARDNAINERLAAIPPDERAAFHATLFSIVRPATSLSTDV
jgi:DNA-binding MarR family transcriptional regulator